MADLSETTPLLPAAHDIQITFPPIISAAQKLPPDPSLFDFQEAYPHALGRSQPLRAVAFRLLLVLHLLVSEDAKYPLSRHSTIEASQELHDRGRRKENLRRIASAILGYIPAAITDAGHHEVTGPDSKDLSVERILFTSFAVHPRSFRRLRVIDVLAHPAVPAAILGDSLISLSLVRLWKFGRAPPLDPPSSESSLFHRFLRIYDAAWTPRTVHVVHLAAHLVYMVLLARMVLYPTPQHPPANAPGGPIGIREPIIIVYSISDVIFNPWSSSTLPHMLVLLSLLSSLPASPGATSDAYDALPLALCMHLLFLIFPRYPTLLLLFEPTRLLPISSLYLVGLKQSLLPAFLFLLPVLIASYALWLFSYATIPWMQAPLASVTPYVAPEAAITLFFVACLLVLYFSACTLLLSSSVRKNETTYWWDWERHGSDIGLAGRRTLVRAVLAYSPSRRPFNPAYPPPLNLLALPLAALPLLSPPFYRVAWRVLVGPFTFVAAGLWCWGLL